MVNSPLHLSEGVSYLYCPIPHFATTQLQDLIRQYLHSPIRLHGAVINEAQGQLYLLFTF
jgi:hypothetical protein